MSDESAITRRTVVVGGPDRVLTAGIAALLRERFDVPAPVDGPGGIDGRIADVASTSRVTLVLLDPRDPDPQPPPRARRPRGTAALSWDAAVADQRRKHPERLGVLVLLSRPSYDRQRRWRQREPPDATDRPGDGRGSPLGGALRADAVLPCSMAPDVLREAVAEVAERPGEESRWWLPRTTKHRNAAMTWPDDGPAVRPILTEEHLHTALVLAARGEDWGEVAETVGMTRDALVRRFRTIKRELGIDSDVALGRWAKEVGLLDDVPAGLVETDENPDGEEGRKRS